MKILVLGAAGMAGHMISLYLQEKEYDVFGLTRVPANFLKNNIVADIKDEVNLKKILKEHNFDIVVNCIGILNKETEKNKSEAVYINSYLPHLIANTLKDTDTKLIHISTDCVFDGQTGGYTENSVTNALSFYGRSKMLGEVNDDKNLTIRTSIIGPELKKNGISLFNWLMLQNGQIDGYANAIWSGVTTLVLAKAIEQNFSENVTGVCNLVNGSTISKYDLCRTLNDIFRINKLKINKDDKFKINRSLICTRKDFSFNVPSYDEMFKELKQWMSKRMDLYPHYQNV